MREIIANRSARDQYYIVQLRMHKMYTIDLRVHKISSLCCAPDTLLTASAFTFAHPARTDMLY